MPAILRIFVYQTDASLSVIGSTPSYDQGPHLGQHGDLEHYEVSDLRGLLEISVTDVLGIAKQALYGTIEYE